VVDDELGNIRQPINIGLRNNGCRCAVCVQLGDRGIDAGTPQVVLQILDRKCVPVSQHSKREARFADPRRAR
jgi:hypothetical protein